MGSWTGLAWLRVGKGGLQVQFIAEKFLSNVDLLTSQDEHCYTELVFPLSSE